MSKVEKYIGESPIKATPTKKITFLIGDEKVTASKIADNAVVTQKIENGAVTSSKIADGAVTGDKIQAHSVTGDDIADGALTLDKLDPDFLVTERMIASNSVTTEKLSGSYDVETGTWTTPPAVTTAKIKNGNVTTEKIANENVTREKIQDGAITEAKLSPTLLSDWRANVTNTVTEGSALPVQSGAVYNAIEGGYFVN